MRADGGRVEFRVLGAVEVWCDGRRIPLIGARHQRVLVMLLLEAGRVVPLERLVDGAWDDDPPATAARQVRKIVAHLRAALPGGPELILTDGPGYRAAPAADQLDLSRFTQGVAAAREAIRSKDPAGAVESLRAALALWRGPVMAGDGGAVIDAAAAVLEERRLAACEQLLELRLALGETREVVAGLRELVRAHPLRESLRGMLMLALYRSGRQADALSEYEELRRALAEELGIDPGRELAALHERILRSSEDLHGPAPAPVAAEPVRPPVQTLPYDLPDFIGRREELRRLLEAATGHDGAVVKIFTIDGMAGCGKTAFAVHAAHLLAPRYPSGQLFVDLHGFTPGRRPLEPAEALEILLTGIGVPADQVPGDLTRRTSLWRSTAARRRTLVVLDNAVDSAQVQPLLPGMCCSLVLVTSRSYLAGLDSAVPLSLGLLTDDDGLRLLAGTLGEERLAAEPDAAVELVRACGRLPLALRIAAARLHNRPTWTIRRMVGRLRDDGGPLGELVAEHRSVAAAIRLSYDALAPAQQRLLLLLGSLTTCDFDVDTAATLVGRPAAEAEDLLEALLDARLLEQSGGTLYTLHDLVRSFARTLAAPRPLLAG